MSSARLVFSLCWLLPAGALAADARIVKVAGPVTIKAVGHSGFVAADAGARLISGDTVRTGPGGVAQLELENGAILLVTGGSTFVLSGEPENPMLEFRLGEWLLGLVKKLPAGGRVRVSTPQAVAAVRGTLFWGKTDPRETQIAGLENVVEVTAGRKTVRVRAGELVRVPAGGAPEKPARHAVPRSFLDRFAVDGSLGGLEPLAPKK
jgi:hypothetical protein